MSKIISNTGPLIALSMINKLNLLWELYDEVYIPKSVYNEIINTEDENDYGKQEVKSAVKSGKIIVYNVNDKELIKN